MKLLTFSILLIAGVSALAQDPVHGNTSPVLSVVESSTNRVFVFDSTNNRVLIWFGANVPTPAPGSGKTTVKADKVGESAGIIQLRGNVEIETNTALLQADEADFHMATGQADVRGNVRVRLIHQ